MAGGDTIMDFFMQELGVPGSQLLLAAEQTLYMVFLSLFIGTVLVLMVSLKIVLFIPLQIQLLILCVPYHLSF